MEEVFIFISRAVTVAVFITACVLVFHKERHRYQMRKKKDAAIKRVRDHYSVEWCEHCPKVGKCSVCGSVQGGVSA